MPSGVRVQVSLSAHIFRFSPDALCGTCGSSSVVECHLAKVDVAGPNPVYRSTCGCSSMAELQPSKLVTWVRFPSPAPAEKVKCHMKEGVALWTAPSFVFPAEKTDAMRQLFTFRPFTSLLSVLYLICTYRSQKLSALQQRGAFSEKPCRAGLGAAER